MKATSSDSRTGFNPVAAPSYSNGLMFRAGLRCLYTSPVPQFVLSLEPILYIVSNRASEGVPSLVERLVGGG